jgi:hypothetical protein
MGTTISGSIEAASVRQGVEINDFQQAYASMLPRLMSNSSPSLVVGGRKRSQGSVFDDSISSVLSSGKLGTAPNHEMEQRDLGMPKSHYSDTPYTDAGKFDPVGYIGSEDLTEVYPLVMDNVSPVDPGSLDGIIEPFAIRDSATRRLTEGSHSSRRVNGSISDYSEDVFGYNTPLQQIIYSEGNGGKTRPYQEYGIDTLSLSTHGFSYLSDEPITPQAFVEDDTMPWRLSMTDILNDVEIIQSLSGSSSKFLPYGVCFRSSTAGYTYIDNVNGTDSIAFSDRKGY